MAYLSNKPFSDNTNRIILRQKTVLRYASARLATPLPFNTLPFRLSLSKKYYITSRVRMNTHGGLQMNTTQKKRPPRWPRTIPHKERIYVKVHTLFDQTGQMMPEAIIWKDGRVFPIDRVEDYRPASTLELSRTGDCYTVIIRGERKYLFFKRNIMVNDHRVGRWWVEITH